MKNSRRSFHVKYNMTESRRTVKKLKLNLHIISCAAFAASLLVTGRLSASITCNPWVAKMVSVQGNVEVNRAGQTQWLKAGLNDTYCAGDRIQVGERSRADLALVNRPVIRLEQNTTITLAGVREEKRSVIQLIRGALYFFSRLSQILEVATPFVNAGVEGTEGLIKLEADSTLITIFEGKVIASNPSGSLILTSGQSAIARQGSAPVLTTVVRPRDAVQWALYYPPAFDFRPENFQNATWQGLAAKSIASYKLGDFAAAFESIKGVPDTIADPTFFTYRAALLLAVGRNDEARRDVERALSLRAADSAALALQTIIAVAQNDKEKALEGGQKAVTANPKSSSALIALSYAQQANFDLDGARNSLKRAVEVSPNDALAWARLAELHLSFADLDDALEAAKKAAAIDPDLSRTQTVLGFAYLTRVNTAESRKAFERAIELDQADPLPRLGLGLALIRDGHLDAGRGELDIAVSLDPDNSLLRSYLGKAYFEEKLDEQSAAQYELAKS
ncbi:MAG: tetratricopeptide repeat protein, partial [Candidatus Binatia bacterium]